MGYQFVIPPQTSWILALWSGRSFSNCKSLAPEHMLRIKFMTHSWYNALRWRPQNTFDGKSPLVQVMAWSRYAARYYLSQCWPRYISYMTSLGHIEWNGIFWLWARGHFKNAYELVNLWAFKFSTWQGQWQWAHKRFWNAPSCDIG